MLPALINDQHEPKRAKLLQYAANVWKIRQGSDDARIDAAITATREFFHKLGIQTRLDDYDLGSADIDRIMTALKNHGMIALGETQSINCDTARRILQVALQGV